MKVDLSDLVIAVVVREQQKCGHPWDITSSVWHAEGAGHMKDGHNVISVALDAMLQRIGNVSE